MGVLFSTKLFVNNRSIFSNFKKKYQSKYQWMWSIGEKSYFVPFCNYLLFWLFDNVIHVRKWYHTVTKRRDKYASEKFSFYFHFYLVYWQLSSFILYYKVVRLFVCGLCHNYWTDWVIHFREASHRSSGSLRLFHISDSSLGLVLSYFSALSF